MSFLALLSLSLLVATLSPHAARAFHLDTGGARLKDAFLIDGDSGVAVAQCRVTILRTDGSQAASVSTDSTGYFLLFNALDVVDIGAFVTQCTDDATALRRFDEGEWRLNTDVGVQVFLSTSTTPAPSDVIVSGIVRRAHDDAVAPGAGVGEATVVVVDPLGRTRTLLTDATGRFDVVRISSDPVDVTPSYYRVVQVQPSGSATDAALVPVDFRFTVLPLSLFDFTLGERRSSLRNSVLDADSGAPLAGDACAASADSFAADGATVQCTFSDDTPAASPTVGCDGSWRYPLPSSSSSSSSSPVRVQCTASAPGYFVPLSTCVVDVPASTTSSTALEHCTLRLPGGAATPTPAGQPLEGTVRRADDASPLRQVRIEAADDIGRTAVSFSNSRGEFAIVTEGGAASNWRVRTLTPAAETPELVAQTYAVDQLLPDDLEFTLDVRLLGAPNLVVRNSDNVAIAGDGCGAASGGAASSDDGANVVCSFSDGSAPASPTVGCDGSWSYPRAPATGVEVRCFASAPGHEIDAEPTNMCRHVYTSASAASSSVAPSCLALLLPPPPSGDLVVRVLDCTDRSQQLAAQVTCRRFDEFGGVLIERSVPPASEELLDDTGHRFSSLPVDVYSCVASSSARHAQSAAGAHAFIVAADVVTERVICLEPLPARIRGSVHSTLTNEPIAGATVTCTLTDSSRRSALSDEHGVFDISPIDVFGDATCVAEVSGFSPTSIGAVRDVVVARARDATASFELDPFPPSVFGTVVDDVLGTPVGGVLVRLVHTDSNEAYAALSDADTGFFEFGQLRVGAYSQVAATFADVPGFSAAQVSRCVPQACRPDLQTAGAATMTLPAAVSQIISFRLVPLPSSVRVVVFRPSDERAGAFVALADATVRCRQRAACRGGSGGSDDDDDDELDPIVETSESGSDLLGTTDAHGAVSFDHSVAHGGVAYRCTTSRAPAHADGVSACFVLYRGADVAIGVRVGVVDANFSPLDGSSTAPSVPTSKRSCDELGERGRPHTLSRVGGKVKQSYLKASGRRVTSTLRGAVVRCSSSCGSRPSDADDVSATTNRRGRWVDKSATLRNGNVTCTAYAQAHVPARVGPVFFDAHADDAPRKFSLPTIQLRRLEACAALDARGAPYVVAQLRGRVLDDESRAPIKRATVRCTSECGVARIDASDDEREVSVRTDADGVWLIDGGVLRNGDVQCTATASGFRRSTIGPVLVDQHGVDGSVRFRTFRLTKK